MWLFINGVRRNLTFIAECLFEIIYQKVIGNNHHHQNLWLYISSAHSKGSSSSARPTPGLLVLITVLIQLLSRSKYYLWFYKSKYTDAVCLYSMFTETFGSLASKNEKTLRCLLRRLFLEIRLTRTIRGVCESNSPPVTCAVNGP